MRTTFVIVGMVAVALWFCQPSSASAQKKISAADKKEIIQLFKGVSPKKYRLQFNHGRQVYGRKKVSMAQLREVKRFTTPGEANGYVVLIVEDDGIMYVLAATKGRQDLVDVLGEAKAAKLAAITEKYARQ